MTVTGHALPNPGRESSKSDGGVGGAKAASSDSVDDDPTGLRLRSSLFCLSPQRFLDFRPDNAGNSSTSRRAARRGCPADFPVEEIVPAFGSRQECMEVWPDGVWGGRTNTSSSTSVDSSKRTSCTLPVFAGAGRGEGRGRNGSAEPGGTGVSISSCIFISSSFAASE